MPSLSLHRWILTALCAALVLVSPAAAAEVTVPAPGGWSADANASRAALSEAEAWAEATGLEPTQVASPDESDAFVENLVVLLAQRPMHPEILEHEPKAVAAVTELANQIFDAREPPQSEGLFQTGGTTGVRARWEVDGTTWDLVLVPAGAEHALIVLKTRSVNRSLHGDLIEDLIAGIAGASPPIAPFPLKAWHWSLFPGWLLIAAIAHVVALRRNDQEGDHLPASRTSSIAVALTAIVATGLTYVVIAGMDVRLELAGTDSTSLALEMLGAGVVVALALVVLGRLLGGRPERVESAPRTGVFSAEIPSTPPASPRPAGHESQKSPVPRPLGPAADADVGSFHRHDVGDHSGGRPRGG